MPDPEKKEIISEPETPKYGNEKKKINQQTEDADDDVLAIFPCEGGLSPFE